MYTKTKKKYAYFLLKLTKYLKYNFHFYTQHFLEYISGLVCYKLKADYRKIC